MLPAQNEAVYAHSPLPSGSLVCPIVLVHICSFHEKNMSDQLVDARKGPRNMRIKKITNGTGFTGSKN